MQDEEKEEKRQMVPFTILELALVVFVVLIGLTGAAFGAGFYFGTKTTSAAEVAGLCQSMARAYEGQLGATKVTCDGYRAKVERYDAFLVNVNIDPFVADSPLKVSKKNVGGP